MKTTALSVLLLISVVFGSVAAKNPKNPTEKTSRTFVLVHGAWMAPYAWENVTKSLKKAGAKVVVVELPGHGSDTTASQLLSLDAYKSKVADAINSVDGKVILVGHSLAGMIISAVAESYPDKIEKLIYVGAYLPTNGQSLLAIASTDAKSLLGPSLIPSADKLTLDVKHENIINIFCADSSPANQALVMKNYRVEPAIPFTNPVTLTNENFGKVNKAYVHTLQDHVISIEVQNQMVSTSGVKEVYSLNSSHTPFLSMPDKLASLLIKIAQ